MQYFDVCHNFLFKMAESWLACSPDLEEDISAVQHSASDIQETNSLQDAGKANVEADLVDQMQNYRCIWDTSCRSFKETNKKQQAWRELAVSLKENGKLYCWITNGIPFFKFVNKHFKGT